MISSFFKRKNNGAVKLFELWERDRIKYQKDLFIWRLDWDKMNNKILKFKEEAAVTKLEEEIYISQLHNLYFAVKTLSDK